MRRGLSKRFAMVIFLLLLSAYGETFFFSTCIQVEPAILC